MFKQCVETLVINGVEYVPKEAQQAKKIEGMDYCIVRTYSAGVFAGYLQKREGQEATILKVRRLWYWDGAASLSQLSIDGVSKPANCKFPAEVEIITVLQVIEIIPCTEKAQKSIQGVAIWKV